MIHKDEILRLRAEGKTYNQIKEITGASKGTIAYHLGAGQKEKARARQLANPVDHMQKKSEGFSYRKPGAGKRKATDLTRLGYWKARDFQRRVMGSNQLTNAAETVQRFSFKNIVEKFGNTTTCYLTGDTIDLSQGETFEFDHIVPVSKGGDNSIGNLGIATSAANKAKGNLTLEEFVQLCRKVVANYDLTSMEESVKLDSTT